MTKAPRKSLPPGSSLAVVEVREAVVEAVAYVYGTTPEEVEQEIKQQGNFAVKSGPAHAVLANVAKTLGIATPKLSDLHRDQSSTVTGLIDFITKSWRKKP